MEALTNDTEEVQNAGDRDHLIALGVLLWEVARADDDFLPQEKEQIIEILTTYNQLPQEDLPIVLQAIETASNEKIEIFTFTKTVGNSLSREHKMETVEQLFRVGCADQELDEKEVETIRMISQLFGLDHTEFINAKIKVKKEFGMDTAGL